MSYVNRDAYEKLYEEGKIKYKLNNAFMNFVAREGSYRRVDYDLKRTRIIGAKLPEKVSQAVIAAINSNSIVTEE